MKKTTLALLLATSLSPLAGAETTPTNPAAFSVDLINQAAKEDAENKKASTRNGLQDILHNRCLRSSLDSDTPVEEAQRSCRDFIAAMTKPRRVSVLDLLWLQTTFETITSKTATAEEKHDANYGLIEFIKTR